MHASRFQVGLILLAISVWVSLPLGAQTLTVGLYDNSPKIFRDADGDAQGLFIDLLEYIAEERGWVLEYRFGSFSELLTALANDEIDILPDTAFTTQRAERIRFSTVSVVDGWLQVFAPGDRLIADARDLDGARIAVLASSRQEELLRTSIPQLFGIGFEVVPFDDYARTQEAVLSGEADLLVASRFFEFSPTRDPGIVGTSVIFEPSRNLYGFRPGIAPDIVAAVDDGVASLQNTPGSEYYRSLQYWLDPPTPGLPPWARFTLIAGLLLVVGLAISVPVLRRALRSARQSYREVFNAVGDGIIVRDAVTGAVTDANAAALELFGAASVPDLALHEDLSRRVDAAGADYPAGHASERIEWQAEGPDGASFWAEMSTRYARIGRTRRSFSVVRDISDRKVAELELRSALEERSVLLKELHHRTKNNLQVIASLIRMQADTFDDPRLIQAFEQAQRRVETMAAAHEKLYSSTSLARIDIADYLRDLCAAVMGSRVRGELHVDVQLDIEAITLDMDAAVSLGLVLNELVTNSLQHAFPEPTQDARVRATLTRGEGTVLLLRYTDNGRGLPDGPGSGSDPVAGSGLGMELVRAIITSQLRGSLTVGNAVGGSGFVLEAQLYAR